MELNSSERTKENCFHTANTRTDPNHESQSPSYACNYQLSFHEIRAKSLKVSKSKAYMQDQKKRKRKKKTSNIPVSTDLKGGSKYILLKSNKSFSMRNQSWGHVSRYEYKRLWGAFWFFKCPTSSDTDLHLHTVSIMINHCWVTGMWNKKTNKKTKRKTMKYCWFLIFLLLHSLKNNIKWDKWEWTGWTFSGHFEDNYNILTRYENFCGV